jgi:hypothetical protein
MVNHGWCWFDLIHAGVQMKYDDLYTNPKNTKPPFSIKKHIEVIAPVQYTTKPPFEVTLVAYLIMALIFAHFIADAIGIVLHIYNGINDLIYGDDDHF